MSENKLKRRIFWFFIIAKLFTVVFIIAAWDFSAFKKNEMFSILTLILPLFTVYTSVMFDEIVKNRYVNTEQPADRKLQATFRNIVYFALPVYVFAILGIILLTAINTFSFAEMQAALTALEGGFGIYIGRIIFSLFKQEKDN